MAFNYKLIAKVKEQVKIAAHKMAGETVSNKQVKTEASVLNNNKEPNTFEFTKYPNINPVYPRVQFGPTNDPKKVVQPTIKSTKPFLGRGQDQPNPAYSTVRQGLIPPSFGNVSKNLVTNLIPTNSKQSLDPLEKDFYTGPSRINFYKNLDKSLTAPNSQEQTNKNIENFRASVQNMARWAAANRVNRFTDFSTLPRFGGGANPDYLEPTYTTEIGYDGGLKSIRPNQNFMAPYTTEEKSREESSLGRNPLDAVLRKSPANAVFLHELEHTNQASAPRISSPADARTSDFEMPAVLSEIAHQTAAAREATGRYPKGDFYGVPYETIAREAQRRGHVYGNIPMTELLKQPDAQRWLAQLAKGVKK